MPQQPQQPRAAPAQQSTRPAAAPTGRASPPRSDSPFFGACFNCNTTRHRSAECPHGPRCYNCWQLGHTSQECPNPRAERPAHVPVPMQCVRTPGPESCQLCVPGSHGKDVPPLHAKITSVDGKLTSGEPRIGLDSPDVRGIRRTATSATSGRATPAMKRPLHAGGRGNARYAASTRSTTFGDLASAKERPILAEWRLHHRAQPC